MSGLRLCISHIRCGRQKFWLQALWFVLATKVPGEKSLVWAPPFPSGLISSILHSYHILLPPTTVLPCTPYCWSHPCAIPPCPSAPLFGRNPEFSLPHHHPHVWLLFFLSAFESRNFFSSTLSHPNEHHQKCKRQTPGSPSSGAWPSHELGKSTAETAREVLLELWLEPAQRGWKLQEFNC